MIKLGLMVRASTEEELERQLAFVGELGLDVVDIHLGEMPRNTGFLSRIKMQCLEAGLPISYLGGGSFVGPDEEAEARMAQGKADVDVTAFLGAQMLRVFARNKWPDTVEEQESYWGPMIEAFQEISDYATEKGVVLGLQNHNHGSFCMNANQALRILREVDRENFTFILDTGQWQGSVGGSPRGWRDINVDIYRDHIEPTAPHASSVRAKIYKIDNGWEEWIDYPRVFKILQANDFNGNISIVFEGGVPPRNRYDKDECLRLAAKHLREVIALSYI